MRTFPAACTLAFSLVARAASAGEPPSTPVINVEKLLKMKPADAAAALKASGRWASVKSRDGSIYLEGAEFQRTGKGKKGTRGVEASVDYFRGKLVYAFVRYYPGVPPSPALFNFALGITAQPPAPDRDFSNKMTHRLDWNFRNGERAFGPVHKAETFHTVFMDGSEWTLVAVSLADEATMKAWENEDDKKPAKR